MDDYKKKQISALAEEQLSNAGITALPVDPFAVAHHLQITVQAKPPAEKGASAWLVKSGNEFGILYSTHVQHEGFQRFSVGHEIGHFCLPGHPEHVFRDGNLHASSAGFGSSDAVELEADHFSASLLMPTKLFRRAANAQVDGLDAVRGLSNLCKTSLEATAIRYAETTQSRIAVVVSQGRSVLYSVLSTPFKNIRGARRLSRGSPFPSDSATARLNADLVAVRAGGEDSDEVDAQDWFTSIGRYSLVEEAIGLGSYGRTLTILTMEDDPDDPDSLADDEDDEPRFRR